MVLGHIMTAAPPLNAIPAVVAAAPGIATYNDLPLVLPRGIASRDRASLLEEVGLFARDHRVERLERVSARDRRSDLRVRLARHVGIDEHRRARGLGEQLRLAASAPW